MAGTSKALQLIFSIGGAQESSFNSTINSVQNGFRKMTAEQREQIKKMNYASKEYANSLKSLKTATSDMSSAWGSLGNSIISPLKTIASVGAIVSATLYGVAMKTATWGDAAFKTAKIVGMTTQAYSEMQYAGELSGLSAGDFASAMTKLNKTMVLAMRGNNEAVLTFRRVGRAVRGANNEMVGTEEMLMSVSDQIRAMTDRGVDDIHKISLATAVFGRSGAQMLPFLELGREGVQKLREEAVALGITFDDITGAEAEKFNDSLSKLKASFRGVITAIGNELIPVFTQVNGTISAWVMSNRDIISSKAKGMVEYFKANWVNIKEGVEGVFRAIATIAKIINGVVEKMGGWEEAVKTIVKIWAGLQILKIVGNLSMAIGATVKWGSAVSKVVRAFVLLGKSGGWLAASFKIPVLGWIIKSVVWLGKGIGALASGITATGAVIAVAIGALVGFFVYMEVKLKTFSKFFKNEWAKILEGFRGGFFKGIFTLLIRLVTLVPRLLIAIIKDFWSAVKLLWDEKWFKKMVRGIADFFWWLGGVIADVLIKINLGLRSLFRGGFWSGVGKIFLGLGNLILNAILLPFKLLRKVVTGFFGAMFDLAKEVFISIFGEEIYGRVRDFIKGLLSGVVDWIKGAGSSVKNAVMSVIDGIGGLYNKGKEWISAFFSGIFDFIKGIGNKLKDAVVSVLPEWAKRAMGIEESPVAQATGAVSQSATQTRNVINNAVPNISPIIPSNSSLSATSTARGGTGSSTVLPPSANMLPHNIPRMAFGGIVNKPTLAMVGESGAEAVIPLNKPSRANEILQQLLPTTNNTESSSFVFSPTVHITTSGENAREVKSTVENSLKDLKGQFEKWIQEREHRQRRVAMV